MPLSQGHPYNTILLEMMAKQCFYVKNKQTKKTKNQKNKQTNKSETSHMITHQMQRNNVYAIVYSTLPSIKDRLLTLNEK